jgi:hypothetical protein
MGRKRSLLSVCQGTDCSIDGFIGCKCSIMKICWNTTVSLLVLVDNFKQVSIDKTSFLAVSTADFLVSSTSILMLIAFLKWLVVSACVEIWLQFLLRYVSFFHVSLLLFPFQCSYAYKTSFNVIHNSNERTFKLIFIFSLFLCATSLEIFTYFRQFYSPYIPH